MQNIVIFGYNSLGAKYAQYIKDNFEKFRPVIIEKDPEQHQKALQDGYTAILATISLDSDLSNMQVTAIIIADAYYKYLRYAVQKPTLVTFLDQPIFNKYFTVDLLANLQEYKQLLWSYPLREPMVTKNLISKLKQITSPITRVNIVWHEQLAQGYTTAGILQEKLIHILDLVRYVLRGLKLDITPNHLKVSSAFRTQELIDAAKQQKYYSKKHKEHFPMAKLNCELQLGNVVIGISASFLKKVTPYIEFVGQDFQEKLELDDNFILSNDSIKNTFASLLQILETKTFPAHAAKPRQIFHNVSLTTLLEDKADNYIAQHKHSNPLFLFDINKQTTLSQPTEQALTVISLDYDGCGCILFQNIEDNAHQNEHAFFAEHLKAISQDKRTILYVGSNRQDHEADNFANSCNKNGLCFSNFKTFAKKMQWHFNELLLADITISHGKIMNTIAGKSMADASRTVEYDFLEDLHYLPKIRYKLNIIVMHLNDIAETHPDKQVTYYFYDDDADDVSIFEAFKNLFAKDPARIPDNVHVILMKYSFYNRVELRNDKITPPANLEYWSSKSLVISDNKANLQKRKTSKLEL